MRSTHRAQLACAARMHAAHTRSTHRAWHAQHTLNTASMPPAHKLHVLCSTSSTSAHTARSDNPYYPHSCRRLFKQMLAAASTAPLAAQHARLNRLHTKSPAGWVHHLTRQLPRALRRRVAAAPPPPGNWCHHDAACAYQAPDMPWPQIWVEWWSEMWRYGETRLNTGGVW